jgi:hypothetical protein
MLRLVDIDISYNLDNRLFRPILSKCLEILCLDPHCSIPRTQASSFQLAFDQMDAQEQAFHNGPCPGKDENVRKECGRAVELIVHTWSEILIVTQFQSLKCSGDLYSHSECALSALSSTG